MPNLVNAYVLFNGTNSQYVGNDAITISINCERLKAYSPRPVWLLRTQAPGDGTIILYEPTFAPSSAQLNDPNTLVGFWIEQDGQDTMIDVTTQAAFQTACDACCGTVPTIITGTYNGTVPSFTPLGINTICVTSFDSGSAGDHDAFAAKYAGEYIGVARLRSNLSGVSNYTITTYWTAAQFPVMGSDTAVTGNCP